MYHAPNCHYFNVKKPTQSHDSNIVVKIILPKFSSAQQIPPSIKTSA